MFSLVFILILGMFIHLLKKAKTAEMKARESQTQAEKANAAKSAFLFNMSHDIRIPMNALLGYNQLMKKELTDPKLLHYQRAIENSGNLLLAIIKIQIEVRDTGIGMSKDFLPTLFEPFSRERNTTVGKVAGTGLGMAIVKRYVDLMGGSILIHPVSLKKTISYFLWMEPGVVISCGHLIL